MLITITGATGTIGADLVRLLADAGAPTRAILRDLRKLRTLPGVAWTQADLADPRLLEPALAGTTRLFLLTGNDSGFARLQGDVVRAAERLGVAHVVKLSALGAGRVPFVDTRDIAEVAARILLDPAAHVGKKYTLTGGKAVDYDEVAAVLAAATGKPVTYHPISMEEARARMEARGVPDFLIDANLALAAYQKAGGPTERVSDDVARLLGRPPHTVQDFARDHTDAFRLASRT